MNLNSIMGWWNSLTSTQKLITGGVILIVAYALVGSGGTLFNSGQLIAKAIIVLIAFPVHEFAHAAAAVWLGDDTPKYMGRYTLNPLVHIDPMGAILIFLTGFGWAKPVQWNPRNVDIDPKMASIIVSLAGPLSNLLMAALGVIFAVNFVPDNQFLRNMATFFVYINVLLFVFNMIPIPPLDGSHVLFALMPGDNFQLRAMLGQYGFIMLFLVIFLAPQIIQTPTFVIFNLLLSLFS